MSSVAAFALSPSGAAALSPPSAAVAPAAAVAGLAPGEAGRAASATGYAQAGLPTAVAAVAAAAAACRRRQRPRGPARRPAATRRRATTVVDEAPTDLAPWEIDTETEEERQARYKREAEEMKLKWDARRLEEKQSAERRIAHSNREKEREMIYGSRDYVMEAYEARMYEEARVLEVCRKQREVYERIKAFKLGRPLPPKGEPYVPLRPSPVQPPSPEDLDISGYYDPMVDVEELKYKAPPSFVSSTGPAPPPRTERGLAKAAWEDPPYQPAGPAQRSFNKPAVGSVTELPKEVLEARKVREADGVLPQPAHIKKMRVPELKVVLKKVGLDLKGDKETLIERLTSYVRSRP